VGVSIPHWSDFNGRGPGAERGHGLGCFNPTLVRFQLTGSYRSTCPMIVSIPHWSDFNALLPERDAEAVLSFNPTLVRFQHSSLSAHGNARLCFNPTLVRFQPSLSLCEHFRWAKFQSHIGPISTGMYTRPQMVYSCFNPTLVRFQRIPTPWGTAH